MAFQENNKKTKLHKTKCGLKLKYMVCFSGINYLHKEAPVKVIHRDLKSKNGKYIYIFYHFVRISW